MKERTQQLRRVGVAGFIAAFVAAWAIVFGQLAFGHDPALGQAKTAQSKAKTVTAQPDDLSSEDDSGSTASTPAPVTTGQS